MSSKLGEEEMMMKSGSEMQYRGKSEPWYAISKKKALILFLVVFLIVLLLCILVGVFARRYALESCGTEALTEKKKSEPTAGPTPSKRPTGKTRKELLLSTYSLAFYLVMISS